MKWPDVIKEIQAHGKTQGEIATEVGTSQGHISDLLSGNRGKQIGFTLGLKLLDMRDRLATRTPKRSSEQQGVK